MGCEQGMHAAKPRRHHLQKARGPPVKAIVVRRCTDLRRCLAGFAVPNPSRNLELTTGGKWRVDVDEVDVLRVGLQQRIERPEVVSVQDAIRLVTPTDLLHGLHARPGRRRLKERAVLRVLAGPDELGPVHSAAAGLVGPALGSDSLPAPGSESERT